MKIMTFTIIICEGEIFESFKIILTHHFLNNKNVYYVNINSHTFTLNEFFSNELMMMMTMMVVRILEDYILFF